MNVSPMLRAFARASVPLLGALSWSLAAGAQAAPSGPGNFGLGSGMPSVLFADRAASSITFLNPRLASLDDCEDAEELLALADTGAGKQPLAQVAQVAAEPAAPPPPPPPVWEIVPADRTLNTALARWATTAGWQLVWEVPVDYAVQTRTAISGSFHEAIEAVTKSMGGAEIPLAAIFYEGNKVLRIVAKGAE